MSLLLKSAFYFFLISLLIACSVQPVTNQEVNVTYPKPVLLQSDNADQKLMKYWWNARFKFIWNEKGNTVNFSDNLFIAHQVILPVLNDYSDGIKLWRFHRRAADDAGGHQFSFVFYSSVETAGHVFQKIDSNSLLNELLEAGILEQIKLDNIFKPRRQNIEDTSDKKWSVAIQKSWPYYIMGVSTLWLDLIVQEIQESKLDTSQSIQAQKAQYQLINEQITLQWKEQGKHAFFHHINAIFGYEPLNVRF